MRYCLILLIALVVSSCAPLTDSDEVCDPLAENPHFKSECKQYNCTNY